VSRWKKKFKVIPWKFLESALKELLGHHDSLPPPSGFNNLRTSENTVSQDPGQNINFGYPHHPTNISQDITINSSRSIDRASSGGKCLPSINSENDDHPMDTAVHVSRSPSFWKLPPFKIPAAA